MTLSLCAQHPSRVSVCISFPMCKSFSFLLRRSFETAKSLLWSLNALNGGFVTSNLLCISLSFSSLALVECRQTGWEKNEKNMNLMLDSHNLSWLDPSFKQLLDRQIVSIIGFSPDLFVYFFNLFHPFKMCEEVKKRLDSLLLHDGFQTSPVVFFYCPFGQVSL